MKHLVRWLPALAAACGLLLGMATAEVGHATTYTFNVYNYPGTHSSTATLNCGWHVICEGDNPYDGPGLDWHNSSSEGSNTVNWRSFSANDQSYGYAGSVQVQDGTSGSCHTARAALFSPSGAALDRINYLHTSPYGTGGYTAINSGSWPASTEFRVGTTVDNDCGQFAAHLHQERDSSNWTKNYYPTRANCENGSGCSGYINISVWSNYQHHRTRYASGY
jgi:hypothetical protein